MRPVREGAWGDASAFGSIVSGVLEAAMARRRIGQEQLAIVGSQPRGATSPDEMSQLVDRCG